MSSIVKSQVRMIVALLARNSHLEWRMRRICRRMSSVVWWCLVYVAFEIPAWGVAGVWEKQSARDLMTRAVVCRRIIELSKSAFARAAQQWLEVNKQITWENLLIVIICDSSRKLLNSFTSAPICRLSLSCRHHRQVQSSECGIVNYNSRAQW